MCPAGSLRPAVLRFGCWTHDTSPHSTNSRWSLVRALVALGLWASLQRSSKPPAPYRSLGRAVAAIAACVFLFGRYAPSRYVTSTGFCAHLMHRAAHRSPRVHTWCHGHYFWTHGLLQHYSQPCVIKAGWHQVGAKSLRLHYATNTIPINLRCLVLPAPSDVSLCGFFGCRVSSRLAPSLAPALRLLDTRHPQPQPSLVSLARVG